MSCVGFVNIYPYLDMHLANDRPSSKYLLNE